MIFPGFGKLFVKRSQVQRFSVPGYQNVLNFEFRSLVFVWYLIFGAWNLHDFNK